MKKVLALAMAMLMMLSFVGCGSGGNDTAANEAGDSGASSATEGNSTADSGVKKGGTMVFNLNADPGFLSPFENFGGMGVNRYVYEFLLVYDADGIPQPLLAESMIGDAENLTYTIKIKKGVKFHDGSDMTSEVVAWNLNYYKEFGPLTSSFFQAMDTAEAVDEDTVVIHMNRWDSLFPLALARACAIVSKEAFDTHGEEYFMDNMVGTGAFMLDSWERDTAINLKAFKDYWGGEPNLDGIHMPVYTTIQVAQAALQTGDIDVLNLGNFPDFAVANQLSSDENVNIVTANLPTTAYNICFNCTDENDPLYDVNVRKAISYAIDSQAITDTVTYGFGVVSNQWCMPSSPYYNDSLEMGGHDLEKAKQLMKDAGYENGFTTTITLQQGTFEAGAQIIAEQLAQIGITAEINVAPQAGYVSYIGGWDGMLLHPMQMTNSVSQYVATFPQGQTGGLGINSLLHPDDLDALLKEAIAAEDEESTEKFKEVASMVFDKYCMMKVITIVPGIVVENNYVKDSGFGDAETESFTLQNCWLDK